MVSLDVVQWNLLQVVYGLGAYSIESFSDLYYTHSEPGVLHFQDVNGAAQNVANISHMFLCVCVVMYDCNVQWHLFQVV